MDNNKREISLQRAQELHEEIKDFLTFKNEYLMDMSMRRDVMSKQHKKDLLEYFGATGEDWDDWHWQLKNRISSADVLKHFMHLSEEQVDLLNKISAKYRWATTPYYLSLMDYEDLSYPIDRMAIPSKEELDESGELDPMPDHQRDELLRDVLQALSAASKDWGDRPDRAEPPDPGSDRLHQGDSGDQGRIDHGRRSADASG